MAIATILSAAQSRRTRCAARCRGANPRRVLHAWWAQQLPWSLPASESARDVRVKIASTQAEWEEAVRLVTDNYQARGYEAPESPDFRFSSYHALPDTVTFVALRGDRVVATFTLVPDNGLLGLPMEGIYRAEIQDLRKRGRRLAEVTSFACRDLSLREFLPVFSSLVRLMKQYHVHHGGDTWVIAVNPRHRSYYCNRLGYTRLGSCRSYPLVRGAPAEALLLDADVMKANAPTEYRRMFAQRLPDEALWAPRLPPNLVRYFGSRSSQTDRRVVEEILRYVEECGSPRRW